MRILDRDRPRLLAHAGDDLAPADLESCCAPQVCGARRTSRFNILTGAQEFFGINLGVTPDVLIPRPETEHLVEAVLEFARTQAEPHLHIADVGTGSGAIAIALASESLERASITAIDISPEALAVASENAGRLGLAERIQFLQGDLLGPLLATHAAADPLFTGDPLNSLIAGSDPFDPVLGTGSANPALETPTFDIIASNPPYVGLDESSTLAPEVRDHEPALALYAGQDGLDVYRRLVPQALELMKPGGLLAMEIGYGQKDAVMHILAGWKTVRFVDDYAGIPRVALAVRA